MRITFLGAGSTVFARNVLGDVMQTDVLRDSEIALYDINPERLDDSFQILSNINKNSNDNRATLKAYCGLDELKAALEGAVFVVNAVQVGGYDPGTIRDFEIPKKYGLRQTIADTIGVGGVFRALRTIPVMQQFADAIEEVCPDAWLLNYSNPMSILTGYMQRYTKVKTVGLCHSVQVVARELVEGVGLEYTDDITTKVAGINHMAWLLEIKKNGEDLYPEIKQRSLEGKIPDGDRVRHDLMQRFGYYITESSEHNSEYHAFYIKEKYPELIERYNIPLDEYIRRCVRQIDEWAGMRASLVNDPDLSHDRSHEYASYIMEAMVQDKPYKIGGNVLNTGLITNLPQNACVEVPCLVDASGITPTYVGDLPEMQAALNRTNINVHLLTIQAARTLRKEDVYAAVSMDPHTASELSLDDIRAMCDELLEAHSDMMPEYH